MQIGAHEFNKVSNVEPLRVSDGSIQICLPQSRYRNDRNIPLHRYGHGPFCKLKIPSTICSSGVYAIAFAEDVKYLGKCVNLAARFNSGYGQISPRNCFIGGQETNCRVNELVLTEAQAGRKLTLWFHQTVSEEGIEQELLRLIKPQWNRFRN